MIRITMVVGRPARRSRSWRPPRTPARSRLAPSRLKTWNIPDPESRSIFHISAEGRGVICGSAASAAGLFCPRPAPRAGRPPPLPRPIIVGDPRMAGDPERPGRNPRPRNQAGVEDRC